MKQGERNERKRRTNSTEECASIDSCTTDHPIRKLNVRYNLPTSIGIRFVGKTEPETEEICTAYAEFMDEYTKRVARKCIINTYDKLFDYATLACYRLLSDMAARKSDSPSQDSPATLTIEYSNILNKVISRISKRFTPHTININDIMRLDRDHESTRGVKYRRGDRFKGGIMPYGWNKDENGMLIENEREQEVISIIYGMCQMGATVSAIAEKLDADGIPPRNGGKWTLRTIMDIINRGMPG